MLLDVGTDDLECYGCSDKSGNTAFEHMNDYEGKYKKVKFFPGAAGSNSVPVGTD